jgi:hypothetical protein
MPKNDFFHRFDTWKLNIASESHYFIYSEYFLVFNNVSIFFYMFYQTKYLLSKYESSKVQKYIKHIYFFNCYAKLQTKLKGNLISSQMEDFKFG